MGKVPNDNVNANESGNAPIASLCPSKVKGMEGERSGASCLSSGSNLLKDKTATSFGCESFNGRGVTLHTVTGDGLLF